ncbi:hypothetical protein N7462_003957 [Penicillium macrosclerotiorum]|uniref:uncharacterized protein n=1 Tax=Penicillium macrosclerotiorum TaxID=303699 RepID=UPI002546C193|nr:uncharacterized protein N7462_003957 [Penicillium macrosclerotiorum]KAJ5689565.1 hypothetical protein N7462_003957 [Penicillium macrosclerotiorum]
MATAQEQEEPRVRSFQDSAVRTDESSKSGWYLFLLTVSIGGLQVVWSVELSNGSVALQPFLLSLGMSKSLLAVVWVIGPLTGTLVQPYIGIRSDNCRLPWGKRKPFMVVGAAATVVSLLCLAWVREIVGGTLSIFGIDRESSGTKWTTIAVATIVMFCLDFAINTVQAAIRAFIVDNCPAHQQELANAWASRVTGIGNMLGFSFGYMDLPAILPFLGNTQFKVLCALASFSLIFTLLASCLYIQERDPRLEGPPSSDGLGLVSFFRQVFKSIQNLPPQIARVCEVQVAAWVGWFPFLFYSTTYVGQLYVNPIFADHPDMSGDQIDKIWEDATRIGTSALLIYAIISFLANILMPLFVVPTYGQVSETSAPLAQGVAHDNGEENDEEDEEEEAPRRLSISSIPVGTAADPLLEVGAGKRIGADGKPTWLSRLQIPGLTLRRTWLLSHLLFALCMFSTLFISSYPAGSVVIGIVGICWALALWAPFALISAEVARFDVTRHTHPDQSGASSSGQARTGGYDTTSSSYVPVSSEDEPRDLEDRGREHDVEDGRAKYSAHSEANIAQAGIVLGLHNMAVSFPQIFSSLICSAIFKVTQKPRGEPWDDSVGWVLRFGGCAALAAAWLTKRLAEGRQA